MSKVANVYVATVVVLCGVIHHLVSENVKEPFIDEIFHLTQCQTYCKYGFSNWQDHWDNKITTPPGLYILGNGYSYLIELLSGYQLDFLSVCNNNDVLRSVNLLGGLVLTSLLLQVLVSRKSIGDQFWIINIITSPLLFSYYFLFYTDVWSTILIISSLVLAVANPLKSTGFNITLSAILGFLSLLFRQTNIIWIAFIYSYFVDERVARKNSFFTRIFDYIKQIFVDWVYAIPFVLNFLAFAVFIKINGGITFGDKENHEVNLHVVQIFYCFSFMTLFTWPVWLSPAKLIKYVKFVTIDNYGLNLILNIGSMVAIKYIIDNFTIVHPFLLADNRHYTFYIYKKILSHPSSFILTVPVYHFSTWNIIDALLLNSSFSLSPITTLTFLGAIFITIIPSPLFEPRYYIIPVILLRLFIASPNESRTLRHNIEFVWNILVNSIYFIIFFNYEFKWASEGDIIQRIIW